MFVIYELNIENDEFFRIKSKNFSKLVSFSKNVFLINLCVGEKLVFNKFNNNCKQPIKPSP